MSQRDLSTRWNQLREQMVIDQLVARGIKDSGVLEAMSQVPRERFVPESLRDAAYEDRALPIGLDQTISQPYTVAFMVEALDLTGRERVLEVGCGSGYGAAVLSRLAGQVHTVEMIAELAEQARQQLQQLGYANVQVHVADGSLGLPEHAPYDAIVVTAAAPRLPEPYKEQLAEGGRLVIPIGGPSGQSLYRFTRRGEYLNGENLGGFAFVPLVGRYGRHESTA